MFMELVYSTILYGLVSAGSAAQRQASAARAGLGRPGRQPERLRARPASFTSAERESAARRVSPRLCFGHACLYLPG